MQLFRDGTFKSLNAGPFGGAYIRGQYIFQKDTLEFINDSLGGLYPSKRLVLKNNGEKAKFVPTDSAKSMFSMTVHEDNRLRD
ncbi:MAG: hypothetical protein EOO88_24885 [Pedobacter sp.]|nr:MAG: hypothetical protein EOO88_24885 [Pedobacter sp.]